MKTLMCSCVIYQCMQGGPLERRQTGVQERKEGWIFHVILKPVFEQILKCKRFQLSNKSQKEILLWQHRLHPSLTFGSEKHTQEMDVLLRRLLLFQNLEPKQTVSSKLELTKWLTGFRYTGQKITLCSGKRIG